MYSFDEKQYGRIYTDKEDNIQAIKDIIKSIDEDESFYLPDNLICAYSNTFDPVYISKFYGLDLDILLLKCSDYKITCGIIKAKQIHIEDMDIIEIDKCSINKCIKNFYESGFWSKEEVLEYFGLKYLLP